MSSKSRKKQRAHRWKPGVWKMIDDRSGFEVYSDEAVYDEYRGLITSRKNYDPIHYSELPVDFPEDEMKLPEIHSPEPETDTFRDPSTTGEELL